VKSGPFITIALILAASNVLGEETLRDEREPFSISGRVTAAISGSDIVVAGKSVHLEGTRAPKRGRICLRNSESVDIGTEIADGFARKVVGHETTLSVRTDDSGRLVGRGTVNGEDIGEIAISNGFAVTKIGDYSYAAQEREARNNRPGLWSCSSFPKAESAPELTVVTPAPRPLPPPMEVKPTPSPKSRNTVEYLPPDAQLPPPPSEQEDDFNLVLDDVGGFLEGIFTGIDRGIREIFGAPAPPTGPR
jgi:endonuclease YncB( thermonuclease family)